MNAGIGPDRGDAGAPGPADDRHERLRAAAAAAFASAPSGVLASGEDDGIRELRLSAEMQGRGVDIMEGCGCGCGCGWG